MYCVMGCWAAAMVANPSRPDKLVMRAERPKAEFKFHVDLCNHDLYPAI